MGDARVALHRAEGEWVSDSLLTILGPDLAWQRDAACKGVGLDRFAVSGSSTRERQIVEEAKAICATCPVLDECREYALSQPPRDLFGVWGGMTGNDRRKARATALKTNRLRQCGLPFVCEECGDSFDRSPSLGTHRRSIHGIAGPNSSKNRKKAA